ncbi:MAG TPA: alpha/beta hydrolase [Phototrophicaceae bacterium]|jgi:pimeloyl-ACP methyl ester carboxylesterase|nr:alpha/beta hydrolase [Phototrophicaceae bacterium]
MLKIVRVSIALLALLLITVVSPIHAQTTFTAEELADPDGQFIDIDGISIYYIERGDSTNPAVLLLHGFGGSTFTWRDNMDAIADAGFHVIAFDRPPYGLASKSTDIDYTPDYYAELTEKLMDAWGIDSAILVGHSAGGGVIAHFALTYPDRVKALVFVAGAVPIEDNDVASTRIATPEADSDSGDESPIGSLFSFASSLDPDTPLSKTLIHTLLTPERFTDILSGAYYDPSIVTDAVSAGYQRPLQMEGWERAFLKLLTARTANAGLTSDSLATISVPTLLIWGQEDTWVPLTAGEQLAAIIPGATLITYPEVGHLAMEENTVQFNADLVAWLVGLAINA